MRLVLLIYLIIACFAAGILLLQLFFRDFRLERVGASNYLIFGFFWGATAYGIVLTIAGFAGILNLSINFLLTVPVLWAAYPLLIKTTAILKIKLQSGTNLQIFSIVVILCFTGVSGLLVFSKGLYPGSFDNDVW